MNRRAFLLTWPGDTHELVTTPLFCFWGHSACCWRISIHHTHTNKLAVNNCRELFWRLNSGILFSMYFKHVSVPDSIILRPKRPTFDSVVPCPPTTSTLPGDREVPKQFGRMVTSKKRCVYGEIRCTKKIKHDIQLGIGPVCFFRSFDIRHYILLVEMEFWWCKRIQE